MTEATDEIVRGSGNVFRDFGYPDADVRQVKALMGAKLMRVLEGDVLSTHVAEECAGISKRELYRIRKAQFSRFTIDRLMVILALLDQEVDLSISVNPRRALIDAVRASARATANAGSVAALSQDFVYDDDGLPR